MAGALRRLAGTQSCSQYLLLIAVALAIFGSCYLKPGIQKLRSTLSGPSTVVRKMHSLQIIKLWQLVYPQPDVLTPSRGDVLVVTPWLAPIIWEGTFNTKILDHQFRLQNATIGLTVFALGSDVSCLRVFLETAEMFFMANHRVNYYIFTDRPDSVPDVSLQPGRRTVVLEVPGLAGGQNASTQRMQLLSAFSRERFQREVRYLVCADVSSKFSNHVGVEILSSLFAALHPGYLGRSRKSFQYERRPQSQAHIPKGQGDFYYTGSFFGGSVLEVYRLTRACHEAMALDRANHVEAVRRAESHLNKYLLAHKPTKVLSPEYTWDARMLERCGEAQAQVLSKITKQIKFTTWREKDQTPE
ncbi:histo-blood group ABO system transferase-like [Talpa occidentalis]|uniref:histo-blood group ABO system transferase-like n=1 Tax=Talpa occidentalis TaxID=50954 RepID=UPI001890B087|nr:histo-blood group ABO system transferase-like [Talpa occidentalis]